jgi:hypothetical protein
MEGSRSGSVQITDPGGPKTYGSLPTTVSTLLIQIRELYAGSDPNDFVNGFVKNPKHSKEYGTGRTVAV